MGGRAEGESGSGVLQRQLKEPIFIDTFRILITFKLVMSKHYHVKEPKRKSHRVGHDRTKLAPVPTLVIPLRTAWLFYT